MAWRFGPRGHRNKPDGAAVSTATLGKVFGVIASHPRRPLLTPGSRGWISRGRRRRRFWLITASVVGLLTTPAAAEQKVRFPEGEIRVGAARLRVEVARTPEQIAHGLMFRRELGERGMIFLFDDERPRSFWMKNTFVPLSIGFFDSKKRLIDMQDMEPVRSEMETPKSYDSRGSAQFVLEVPRGWFQKNRVRLGHSFVWLRKPGP